MPDFSIYLFMYRDILVYETTDVFKALAYVETKINRGYFFERVDTD